MSAGRSRSAGDRLMDSLAENYEQRLVQLQTVIQDLTNKLETSSQDDSTGSDKDCCDDIPLSQCSSNENLATELSQLSPPRFASTEDLSTQQDSTSKDDGSTEAAERTRTGPNNTVDQPLETLVQLLNMSILNYFTKNYFKRSKLNCFQTTPLSTFSDETQASLELDRLRAKVDSLDCQKVALEASLHESQSYCEQLTILLGRFISNQQLLKTILDEERRLLQATEFIVSVVRLEKQEVIANCRLSAPCASKDRQSTNRLKVSLDKLQEEKKALAVQIQQLVKNEAPKTSAKGKQSSQASEGIITFEEAQGVLMNFGHELRAKCSTLRIAIPNIDTASLPEMTFIKPSSVSSGQQPQQQQQQQEQEQQQQEQPDIETVTNQQELLQLREQVASLKLSFHMKDRECCFYQSELAAKESMLDTVQEQADLFSQECQRLELTVQRTASHEPFNHSGCGEALSCPSTELCLKREKFLKRRTENLNEVNQNLSTQCFAYSQIIKQLQRDNVSLLRRYERVKRKLSSSNQNHFNEDSGALEDFQSRRLITSTDHVD